MFNAVKSWKSGTAQAPEAKEPPVAAKPQASAVQAADMVTRSPVPATMSHSAPAPQTFERNALKAPSCPGICWPADDGCCYANNKGVRVCCIKLGPF